ncbi:MAG TPA: TIR domain-containing protein, partial [Anaerolineales bacterium]|nr:TIR domain-containing protein [Anaerolineales bacterium]
YFVWLDQLDIPTGARWDDEVERALRECEIFLIILTRGSISSENVKDEIGYAIDHGKRILPILLEECEIPLRLRRFQYVDFTKSDFNEGVKRAEQLLESFINERSSAIAPVKPRPEIQKTPRTGSTVTPSSPPSRPFERRWIFGAAILALTACLGCVGVVLVFRGSLFPSTNTPPVQSSPGSTPTEKVTSTNTLIPPTSTLENTSTATPLPTGTNPSTATPPPTWTSTSTPTEPPPLISWTVDLAGVCRDNRGDYPRWSPYNWTLLECQEACQNNPNCQGFAMSQQANYCQLFGSDGARDGSNPGTQITRGDRIQPDYACYLKSSDQSILAWVMDSAGVCRDNAGGYPRWSPYNWTFSQCQEACQNNPNCQGFAMSKTQNYCQLFGSDGARDGSNPNTRITHGDNSQPGYACFIKR